MRKTPKKACIKPLITFFLSTSMPSETPPNSLVSSCCDFASSLLAFSTFCCAFEYSDTLPVISSNVSGYCSKVVKKSCELLVVVNSPLSTLFNASSKEMPKLLAIDAAAALISLASTSKVSAMALVCTVKRSRLVPVASLNSCTVFDVSRNTSCSLFISVMILPIASPALNATKPAINALPSTLVPPVSLSTRALSLSSPGMKAPIDFALIPNTRG